MHFAVILLLQRISNEPEGTLRRRSNLRNASPLFYGEIMSKPFRTHNKQLKILRDRNMLINNGTKAKAILIESIKNK